VSQIRYSRFTFIKVCVKDIKTMNKCRLCLLRLLVTMVFFLAVVPRMSYSGEQSSKQMYILIGQIERCLHVDWRNISTHRESKTRKLPDGQIRLSIVVRMPFLHMALILKNCDIFRITDKEVTKVDIAKKIVLMQRNRTGIMTEKRWRKVADRLLALDKRLLYYAEPYDVPEELIKKYGLEECVIFQDQENKLSIREGTRAFDLELKKHGITLLQQDESKNGVAPKIQAHP
jgi:hypothetical protein